MIYVVSCIGQPIHSDVNGSELFGLLIAYLIIRFFGD